MRFHGDDLLLGDRVYDVSANRGWGTVISVSEGKFQVRFATFSVNYDTNGVQQGHPRVTLYWSPPLVIIPRKRDSHTFKKNELVQRFLDTVREYSEFI